MGIVELRIHGVSGTPPEQVLDDPHPRRVAGDDASAFWRRTNDTDDRFTEEAYEWGGLTSGSPMRATWVLLAPFALVNAAVAMHAERKRVAAALTRLLALSLTVTMVGATYIVSTDLFAWQCGNDDACVARRSWTKVLGWSWLDTPGKRLTLSLLLPLAVILMLWWLARATWQRAEQWQPEAAPPDAPPSPAITATPFDDPEIWNGRERGEFLRHLHIAAAVANVAVLLAYAYVRITDSGEVLLTLAVIVLVATVLLALPEVHPRVPAWRNRAGVVVLVAAWTVLALVALYGWIASDFDTRPQQLPGVDKVVVYLFVAQLGMLFVMLCCSRWPPAALGVVSLAIGAAFSAGVIVQGADLLDPDPDALTLPIGVVWAARGVVVLGTCSALGAMLLALWFVAGRRFGWVPADPVARAEWRARLTDRVPQFTAVGMALLLPVLAGGAAIVVAIDQGWADGLADASEGASWHGWTVFGSRIIALFAIGLMVLARRSYSNAKTRRSVGIVWDVATFWPRRVHPLAPPCYAERAVPELAGRVFELGGPSATEPVFVSAHSQGSIIAVAALLRHQRVFGNVALVTYGSPLDRFYEKYFPAYFPAATTDQLAARLHGHWVNLYRTTDPIGGTVAAAALDWCVPVAGPHPQVHSNYTRESYYADAGTQADGWLTGRLYA